MVEIRRLATIRVAMTSADWRAVGDEIEKRQRWRSGVKQHFFEAQHDKCGYCERNITDYGDVEHYRPKSAIFGLIDEGAQLPNLNNVRKRSFARYQERPGCWDSGYWWLAYSWDNYLLACGRCNQQWKNALFPIAGGHQSRPTEASQSEETPLLLDPFGPVDPVEHLAFTDVGAIYALGGSKHGEQTIAVCGLDRPNLVRARFEKANRSHRLLRELAAAEQISDDSIAKRCYTDLYELGDVRYTHAGMVRCIVVQTLGMTWEQLGALVDSFEDPAS